MPRQLNINDNYVFLDVEGDNNLISSALLEVKNYHGKTTKINLYYLSIHICTFLE